MSEPRQPSPIEPSSSRLATVAWITCSLLVIVFVLAAWMKLRDERTATDLAASISSGERPAAPVLPTKGMEDDGAPGLPTRSERRVQVVNFWASWCGPCKDEAPILSELAADYSGKVDIIGLNAGNEDPESDARRFVRQYEWTFPVVRGTNADKRRWGVAGYPETFIVGADGRVSGHVNGPIDEQTMRAALDQELKRAR